MSGEIISQINQVIFTILSMDSNSSRFIFQPSFLARKKSYDVSFKFVFGQ